MKRRNQSELSSWMPYTKLRSNIVTEQRNWSASKSRKNLRTSRTPPLLLPSPINNLKLKAKEERKQPLIKFMNFKISWSFSQPKLISTNNIPNRVLWTPLWTNQQPSKCRKSQTIREEVTSPRLLRGMEGLREWHPLRTWQTRITSFIMTLRLCSQTINSFSKWPGLILSPSKMSSLKYCHSLNPSGSTLTYLRR